ncbi:MAG: tetratricopeptide repeat protein [Deltaproteobacteria bacterium]|nr:tetratricopeptide repeat protein [Deltaproteobacteria bacterium]
MDQLLERKRPELAYFLLRAMLAMERAQWDAAQRVLRHAIQLVPPRERSRRARRRSQRKYATLQKTAYALLARVEQELTAQARQREELRERKEARKREQARRVVLAAAMGRMKAAVAGRDFVTALVMLREVETLQGLSATSHYFRGYIDFERGRYRKAKRHLQAALRVDPGDRWSRYMLTMTRAKLGERRRARRTLLRLARGDDEVAKVAKVAARKLKRRQAGPKARASGLRLGLEIGGGVDTNPSFLDEVGGSWKSAAWSLRAGINAAYEHTLNGGFFVRPQARLFHRSYVRTAGGEEQDEVVGGFTLGYRDRRLEVEAAYHLETFFYGYELLSLRHRSTLSAGIAAAPWLGFLAQARLATRDVRLEDYAYLEDFELGGFMGLRLVLGGARVELGYELSRSLSPALRAEYVVNAETGTKSPREPVGSAAVRDVWVPYLLEVDYSFWSHGPALWFRVSLPWKLKLITSVSLQWRSFDLGDRLTQLTTGEITDYTARDDIRISGEALLERRLGAGFSLGLGFELLENLSSLDDRESGWDRNYSRHLVELRLAWELP